MKIHKNIFLSIYRTDPCVYKGFPKLLNAKVTRMDIKSLFNYVNAGFFFFFYIDIQFRVMQSSDQIT